jgi:hypothetical protein
MFGLRLVLDVTSPAPASLSAALRLPLESRRRTPMHDASNLYPPISDLKQEGE